MNSAHEHHEQAGGVEEGHDQPQHRVHRITITAAPTTMVAK
jgi:hypothetical protein